jgi:hypothetical protein
MKEGLVDLDTSVMSHIGEKRLTKETCSINIKFPNYDSVKNVYNNDNNYLFNNFSNIKRAANPYDCG